LEVERLLVTSLRAIGEPGDQCSDARGRRFAREVLLGAELLRAGAQLEGLLEDAGALDLSDLIALGR
jgi:hypothetical protein